MSSGSPQLSILVPVKNAEQWLGDALYSIQRQSFTDFECLIIDDHSSDNSNEIAYAFAGKDGRFRLETNQGIGIVDALNTAMSVAQGTWISRMDADDIMPENKLTLFMAAMNGNTRAVVTGKVRYFSPEPVSAGYRAYEGWINERVDHCDHWNWAYRECVIASANWLTHRSHVVFPKDRYPEDYSLVLHWFEKGLDVIAVPHITHWWREHPYRTSRTSDHYQQESFFRLKVSHWIEHAFDPERPVVVLGSNPKSKWTEMVLREHNIYFIRIDKPAISKLDKLVHPQVLIAVYPNLNERKAIEFWLADKGLIVGKDAWWL